LSAAVEHVAGKSFSDFFRRYVSGTDELPCQQVLALAGLRLQATPSLPAPAYEIKEDEEASARQRRIRDGILLGRTDR
jgi:predicted metalloprotease with PDZ domain